MFFISFQTHYLYKRRFLTKHISMIPLYLTHRRVFAHASDVDVPQPVV